MAVSQSLSVTEIPGSANTSANTSQVRILWQSTQTGNSWNGYTRTAEYYVSINGGAETKYTVSYTLPQNTTKTIVDVTITVPHRNDGSGTVSVRTWMDTSISAGVVQKTKTLTLATIPRSSTITTASAVTLGNACKITWTPALASYYFKIKFSIGTWSYTTEAFKPGVTSPYTYTGYTIPLDVASNFPNDPSGTMTATLYTYSDAGITQVGTAMSAPFTVTLPENETTKPSITMTLTPVTPYAKFSSLYLQGISKVKATFSGKGRYGSTITAYSLQAEGKRYYEPVGATSYTSDILTQSGEASIVGFVSDSRWFGNNTPEKINVIEYKTPYLTFRSGYRCKGDGSADESGTYLYIRAKMNYTKINVDGIVNTCSIKCRYKSELGGWSDYKDIGATVDDFVAIPSDIYLDPAMAYTVELSITDDTGLGSSVTFDVPYAAIDFELRDGGKGVAFGRHAIRENTLECEWDARFNNKVSLGDNEIVDVVIKEGSEGIWYYRKWLSGRAECWGRVRASLNISNQWGSVYYDSVEGTAFPSGLFKSAPMCQVTPEYGGSMQVAWMAVGGKASQGAAPGVWFCRPTTSEASIDILYYAMGDWK